MLRRFPGRCVPLLAALSLLAAACGTQLPDSAFQVPGSGAPGSVPIAGTNGPTLGPGATDGPTAADGTQGTEGTQGTAGSRTTGPGGGGAQSGGGNGGCAGENTASATGVTPTSINVGNIVSKSGIFGPDQFTVSFYGAAAYFKALNSQGGVCGRKVNFITCDDAGEPDRNRACAEKLVERDKVFAFVANNIYRYAAAEYVSDRGVSDIGGQPIDRAPYYTYPHLYTIVGSYYENDGRRPDTFYDVPGVGKWFGSHLGGIKKAGVVYYNQTASQSGAKYIQKNLEAAGIKVHMYQVTLGLPNFDAVVVDMQEKGVQGVFDALDINGNQRLCQSMESNGYKPKAKVSTISTWTKQLGSQFGEFCRSIYFSWGNSTNFDDLSNARVERFRAAYQQYFPSQAEKVAQWSMEGWIAAMWFADAARSCGGDLTRGCVERYLNRDKGYGARGLMDRFSTRFPHISNFSGKKYKRCYTIVRWSDSKGGWATVAEHRNTCYTLPFFSYPAA